MLLHPYLNGNKNLLTVPGTRMLQETFGCVGLRIADPTHLRRYWTVHSLYAPIPKRKLGGIRVKLTDEKNFVTFCNQRDFEILIDLAKPGDWCQWMNQAYPEPGGEDWFGFCMDSPDLTDDLFERELALIAENPYGLDPNVAYISRRIHLDDQGDFEDHWVLDPGGTRSIFGHVTLYNRWIRVSRDRVDWKKVLQP